MNHQSTTENSANSVEILTETLLPLSITVDRIAQDSQSISRESRRQSQGIREQNIFLRLISFAMITVFTAIIAGLIYLIRDTLTIIMVSFLIAYILSPMVDYLDDIGLPRSLAVTVVPLLILTSFAFGSIFAVSKVASQIDHLQTNQNQALVGQVERLLNALPISLKDRLIDQLRMEVTADVTESDQYELSTHQVIEASMKRIETLIVGQSKQIMGAVTTSAKGLFSAFINGIIILFTSCFFLSGGREMKKGLIRAVPNRIFEPALILLDGIDRQLGDYLRSRLVQTVIIAIICLIGYLILGLPFAILLGTVAGLANLIPYIGPFIGAIPALAVVFVDSRFGVGSSFIGIIVITIGVQIIDTALVTPLLVGKSVELDPITTVVVVLVGEQFLGLIGMLMAVPLTAMLKLIIEELITQFRGYSRTLTYGGS